MRADSYTLREVAELLGVSKRTLQRRIREGAFPGRFLAPGRHGLETRIPAGDVQRALDDLRRGTGRPQLMEGLTEMRLPTVTPTRELEETRAPSAAMSALTHHDLEGLRDAMLAIVREDRESLLGVLRDALEAREREAGMLRAQLTAIQGGLERIRQRLDQRDEQDRRREAGAVPVGATDAEAEQVLRDLDALEALLGQLQH